MAKVDLFPDFKAFLKSLNAAGVEYLLIGGYAVIYYGYRRTTDDLDVWIALSEDNAKRVSSVMQTFGGFPPSKVKPSLFTDPTAVFIFGREPVRIDILTNASGVDFASAYARRHEVIWDGIKVPLISLQDLKSNKRASGRPKDIADLSGLPGNESQARVLMSTPRKKRKKK
jgi:predicted nucleotidyltransferase